MLTPVTIPVVIPTVAAPVGVLVLVHVPPGVASVRVSVVPAHRLPAPLIAADAADTVIPIVAVQPDAVVYVTVAGPALFPVTIPVDAPTDTVASDDDHVPPVVASLSVIDEPTHTAVVVPVIAAGNAFTVTLVVV